VDLAFAVRLLERDPRLLETTVEVDESARPQDVLEPAIVVLGAVLPRILAEVAHRPSTGHGTGGRRDLAREHPERRGLAGAVAPDDPDLVAVSKIDAESLDDDVAADLDGELASLERDHGELPWDVLRWMWFGRVNTEDLLG
jgi:hypothetical protein